MFLFSRPWKGSGRGIEPVPEQTEPFGLVCAGVQTVSCRGQSCPSIVPRFVGTYRRTGRGVIFRHLNDFAVILQLFPIHRRYTGLCTAGFEPAKNGGLSPVTGKVTPDAISGNRHTLRNILVQRSATDTLHFRTCNIILPLFFSLITEKKLRTQESSQLFCIFKRFLINSANESGAMTFTMGPKDKMRITSSVSSSSLYCTVIR